MDYRHFLNPDPNVYGPAQCSKCRCHFSIQYEDHQKLMWAEEFSPKRLEWTTEGICTECEELLGLKRMRIFCNGEHTLYALTHMQTDEEYQKRRSLIKKDTYKQLSITHFF